jgi:microcystin degradation protein MlrC
LDEGARDGVYLDLHGAAMVDSFPDAEGELLRRVRAVVGDDVPLTISLDPHANLTEQMVRLADAVVPFRTYPHVDMKDAGARAMRLALSRIERGSTWACSYYIIPVSVQGCGGNWIDVCAWAGPEGGVAARRASPGTGWQT